MAVSIVRIYRKAHNPMLRPKSKSTPMYNPDDLPMTDDDIQALQDLARRFTNGTPSDPNPNPDIQALQDLARRFTNGTPSDPNPNPNDLDIYTGELWSYLTNLRNTMSDIQPGQYKTQPFDDEVPDADAPWWGKHETPQHIHAQTRWVTDDGCEFKRFNDAADHARLLECIWMPAYDSIKKATESQAYALSRDATDLSNTIIQTLHTMPSPTNLLECIWMPAYDSIKKATESQAYALSRDATDLSNTIIQTLHTMPSPTNNDEPNPITENVQNIIKNGSNTVLNTIEQLKNLKRKAARIEALEPLEQWVSEHTCRFIEDDGLPCTSLETTLTLEFGPACDYHAARIEALEPLEQWVSEHTCRFIEDDGLPCTSLETTLTLEFGPACDYHANAELNACSICGALANHACYVCNKPLCSEHEHRHPASDEYDDRSEKHVQKHQRMVALRQAVLEKVMQEIELKTRSELSEPSMLPPIIPDDATDNAI